MPTQSLLPSSEAKELHSADIVASNVINAGVPHIILLMSDTRLEPTVRVSTTTPAAIETELLVVPEPAVPCHSQGRWSAKGKGLHSGPYGYVNQPVNS